MPQTIAPPTETLVIGRKYPAIATRIFEAWTDPAQLAKWFAPTQDYTVSAEVDLRVGGSYRIVVTHKGGNVNVVVGTYEVIEEPVRLVYTWSWEGMPVQGTRVTVDIVPDGDSSQVTITHELLPDLESRNKHEQGWNGCLNRLDGMVTPAS